jgi:hypothetical protein
MVGGSAIGLRLRSYDVINYYHAITALYVCFSALVVVSCIVRPYPSSKVKAGTCFFII